MALLNLALQVLAELQELLPLVLDLLARHAAGGLVGGFLCLGPQGVVKVPLGFLDHLYLPLEHDDLLQLLLRDPLQVRHHVPAVRVPKRRIQVCQSLLVLVEGALENGMVLH